MTLLKNKVVVLCLAAVLLPAVGCGGAGTSNTPDGEISPFAASLAPSQWKGGDWTFEKIEIAYYAWDGLAWIKRFVVTGMGTLTIDGGGVGGATSVASVNDGAAQHTAPGYTLDGVTVGDALTLSGHVDGTTVSLMLTGPGGYELRLACAPYDGSVTDDAAGAWVSAFSFEGVGGLSTPDTYGATDSFVSEVLWIGPATSNPQAVPVSFGNAPSIYMDGAYSGDGGTNMAYYDTARSDWSNEEIGYDIELTFTGETVEGTITFDSLNVGDRSDFEGYVTGDTIPVKGRIVGSIVFLEACDASHPEFDWRLIWAPGWLHTQTPVAPPGSVREFYAQYGVHTQTDEHYGGQCWCDMDRQ